MHSTKFPETKKRVLLLLLLLAGVYFAAIEILDRPIRYLGMAKVARSNEQYLSESFDKAVSGFLILSGIKSGLAVIEGSEVGVGFNLELGDIVQSVYDYVDVAWKTALLGGTVILVTRLLIQAVGMLDHWLLALTLAALLVHLILKWYAPAKRWLSRVSRETFFFLTIFSVVFYFVFPFAITGAAFLSERITKPLIEQSQNSFESIKEDFSIDGLQRRILSDNQPETTPNFFDFSIKSRLEKAKKFLQEQSGYLQEKTRNIAIWTIQLIAGYLFDSIIFPVTFFLLLFVVSKSILIYILEDRQKQNLGAEIGALFNKIYGKQENATLHRQSRRRLIQRKASGNVRRPGVVLKNRK